MTGPIAPMVDRDRPAAGDEARGPRSPSLSRPDVQMVFSSDDVSGRYTITLRPAFLRPAYDVACQDGPSGGFPRMRTPFLTRTTDIPDGRRDRARTASCPR